MDGRRDDEVVAYKIVRMALNAVSDLPRGYWRSTPVKQAWTLTETLYQFDIRLSDNPVYYEQSYIMFLRGKAGSRAEFIETSDTVDQKMRQQCSQKQVIDTSRSVDTYLMGEFRQPGKSSEGFGIEPSFGVSRKKAFSEDLFGEERDTIAESGSRRISAHGDEVETGTEVEFTEEVCAQMNPEIHRAALSKHKNSGLKEIPAEEKIIEWSVESCGTDEHHATEMNFVLSPESDELSDEQSDDDYLFEDISDTDFSDVEELDDNDARSETSFASSLKSVACDNVTAIASDFGGGVKANRNGMLGAWALMELKTGGSYQKFCNATHGADETQMCTTEYTLDTLENRTSSGGIDQQLVCETQKKVKTMRQYVTGVILHSWERSWRNGCNRNWMKVSLKVVFRSNQWMNINGKVQEVTEQGNAIKSQWLQCRDGFMMINSPGGRTLASFRWKLSRKWREGLHHDFRRL